MIAQVNSELEDACTVLPESDKELNWTSRNAKSRQSHFRSLTLPDFMSPLARTRYYLLQLQMRSGALVHRLSFACLLFALLISYSASDRFEGVFGLNLWCES